MEYSTLEGKRTHQTYYIGHSFSDDLTVRAFLANQTNSCRPLRMLVGRGSFSRASPTTLWSMGSHVEAQCRRDGLLSAMYDHVEANGFEIIPADGKTGSPELQTQSLDGKAFWATREHHAPVIQSCSQREFEGWDNPFVNADEALGRSVHEKINIEELPNPLLVLWGRHFSGGEQRVGVTYGPQGYAAAVLIGDPQGSYLCEVPMVKNQRVRFLDGQVSGAMRAATSDEIIRLTGVIHQTKNS